MVTCKETCAVIIAWHKKGFTGQDIAASKIALKSTIYLIIKNFKERVSIVVKKASGRPRKSRKRNFSQPSKNSLQLRAPGPSVIQTSSTVIPLPTAWQQQKFMTLSPVSTKLLGGGKQQQQSVQH
ncbi:unnamed protein product [Pleuronectes platessa]|uniref:Uncharacterized protein n=1 Tax=Pleuronectes platessa TaxID=8262 RepID=A0A9N7ZCH9_PLEPL|nr:unnamed protein product [Pleuronectes platessa]